MNTEASPCFSCTNANEEVSHCNFHNKDITEKDGCTDHVMLAESDPRHEIVLQRSVTKNWPFPDGKMQ